MITKKLIHEIQTWLNSLYDFKHPNNERNKHIISSLQNFGFRFIDVRVAIWSISKTGIKNLIESYNKSIKNYNDFYDFKQEVEISINNNIELSIKESIN